jgi:hypothetical protein
MLLYTLIEKGIPMALLRVGINGFGRIGRLVFRCGLRNPNIDLMVSMAQKDGLL